MTLHVAYLINQYPKVSHSFIRREIQALERQGVCVERWAMRGWTGPLADTQDHAERERTRYILQQGAASLVFAVMVAMWCNPVAFLRAAGLATCVGWVSHRPLWVHWVYLAEASLVARWLRDQGISHLHAHFGTNAAQVAMLAHILSGVAYSFTVHGPEEFDQPQALALGEKLQYAAFVVAVSSYGRSQLWRWVPLSQWSKVEVVHCGLEPGFYAHIEGTASQAPRLVCVGRLCEQKGQLLLLQAAALIIRQGLPFELVLAGDGDMRPQVEELIDELNLRDHVRITGWISSSQVRSELLNARALVLPSFAEGLPVVLMEAMALRRPVISTFVAGIPELVRQGREGWLVSPGDVDSLARTLYTCLTAPLQRLSRMGQLAHARVLARHDIDHQVLKLRRLFEAAGQKTVSKGLHESCS
ncbi:MAG: glycosyltransferase family 4 protein [Burkholderiales bacterium]|jgi:colanic acid/amylovoran biosynthesis glycosyltransferase